MHAESRERAETKKEERKLCHKVWPDKDRKSRDTHFVSNADLTQKKQTAAQVRTELSRWAS